MKQKRLMNTLRAVVLFVVIFMQGVFLFYGISRIFHSIILRPGVASVLLLGGFILTMFILGLRARRKNRGILIVCSFAVIGCIFDLGGNPIYNKPIEWLYRDLGKLEVINIANIYDTDYYMNFIFHIVDESGEVVKKLNGLTIIFFRLIEYLIVFGGVLTILTPVIRLLGSTASRDKNLASDERFWMRYDDKRKQRDDGRYHEPVYRQQDEFSRRELSRDVEEELRRLLQEGKFIYGIKYVRQHTSLGLVEAKALVERYKKKYDGKGMEEDYTRNPHPSSPKLSRDVEEEVRRLLDNGEIIYAIKLVREHTSLGLADAKALVEQYK